MDNHTAGEAGTHKTSLQGNSCSKAAANPPPAPAAAGGAPGRGLRVVLYRPTPTSPLRTFRFAAMSPTDAMLLVGPPLSHVGVDVFVANPGER